MYFLAASLLMAAPVFTSCSDDDDPVPEKPVDPKPEEPEEPETPVVKNPIESAITYKTAEGVPQLVLTMGDDQTPVLGKAVVFTPDATEPTKKATLTLTGDQLNLIEMIMSGMSSRASDMTLEELLGQLSAVQLPGVVPGEASTTVAVEISEIKDETVFFSGKSEQDGRTVTLSGTAKTDRLELNVNTVFTHELAATAWSTMPVSEDDPLAPFHIQWKQNLPEGAELPEMEAVLNFVMSMLSVGDLTLSEALNAALQSVTFLPDGNIQASYLDTDNMAAGYQTSPLHLVNYSVDAANRMLYLQLNIPQIVYVTSQKEAALREAESGSDSALQELLPDLLAVLPGIVQNVMPMLTSGIPLHYELNGDQLCLYLGKEVLKPILDALSPLTQSEKVQQMVVAFIEAQLKEAGQEEYAQLASAIVKAFLVIYPQIMESTEDIQLGIELTKLAQ